MIVTFIPAAGRSSRMRGKDKLLEQVNGISILRRTARTALDADLGPVLVGLRPNDKPRQKALRRLDITTVEVPDADEGMAASLRRGAAKALVLIQRHEEDDYEYSGMMVLLPDMPEIEENDLRDIAQNFSASGGTLQRATSADGKLGHPVLFPDHALGDFERLSADEGARSILEDHSVIPFQLPGQRAVTDLDTPEDWAAWRKATNTPH